MQLNVDLKPMLSVIIITKNEENNIRACLDSIKWADEIIVLDSGSSDDTVSICREYTSRIYETDWPGFGQQKQRALMKATHDWVLSLDADEVVSEDLKHEIITAISTDTVQGYEIPRLSRYCGREIKHGGWWPDYVLRLFRRQYGHFSDSVIHERVLVQGKVSKLTNYLRHNAYNNLEEVLAKVNHYSTLGAEMLYQQGKGASVWLAVLKGIWTFFRVYVIRVAFLDGAQGLMLSISNAEGTYYKYLKLYEKKLRDK